MRFNPQTGLFVLDPQIRDLVGLEPMTIGMGAKSTKSEFLNDAIVNHCAIAQ